MSTNALMALFLVPLYVIAAGLRIYAASRNRSIRWLYLASVPGCAVVITFYVSAATGWQVELLTTIARLGSFPTAVLVWIWPAVIAARDRR